MKYDVGDYVRIKNGLVIGEKYNWIQFACDMNDYCGETARIERTVPWAGCYRLDIDNQKWMWTDDRKEKGHGKRFGTHGARKQQTRNG